MMLHGAGMEVGHTEDLLVLGIFFALPPHSKNHELTKSHSKLECALLNMP